MSLPLLAVKPRTLDQRVVSYEVPAEDDPVIYRLTDATDAADVDALIWAAYRQIFSEHLILASYRQPFLESQLRNRAISVQDFIRGLGKSEVYREQVAAVNSNYRLVDVSFKRFLGRPTYGPQEQIAWSIILATRGLEGFIDALVDSDEYQQNFGADIVPYQRRRRMARPFNLVNPRYSDYWRNKEMSLSGRSYYQVRYYAAGPLDKQIIRGAIPANFLSMARSIVVPTLDTQRHVARATSSLVTVPNTAQERDLPPTPVKPVPVALPYRYLPSQPKV
ncbi:MULTISPECIES: phycobilisome rod-core linker polypeptide [unclassified Thermosynechococcus]|uniref:phycobilisome rod-core linker polypeptide n=1 Tax=unclassified Thermosynechococcus TaxID=2622553 RepID=UPI001A0242B7|nr:MULTISPECIES: phycobilisome rod-core linker polypeptide [unclassified Thermosynechococcus]HIK35395.1 phycobilisome rod-core linker polypeptide [Thermosynechococcus sp. M98_K2018_005]HIK48759.1 phycobilisome rod-core linker polypeptide [Thermosynechococcus sp. M55_K2018_012]